MGPLPTFSTPRTEQGTGKYVVNKAINERWTMMSSVVGYSGDYTRDRVAPNAETTSPTGDGEDRDGGRSSASAHDVRVSGIFTQCLTAW